MAKKPSKNTLIGSAIVSKSGSKPVSPVVGKVAASMNEREIKGKKKGK